MEKETLRFKIARKVITYEGYPAHRARDLIDILAKLNVAQDTVVQTFRENIENESEYTDEAILEMFTTAVKARAERKRRQQQEEAAANTAEGGVANNNTSSPRQPDTERPRKITLSYRGRQFSYEGLLSGKQRAVLQLLCKQKDVTREIAVETFHNNLPDVTLSDEEIWQLVCDTLNAKQRGGQHGKEANAEGNGHAQEVHQHQQGQQQQQDLSPCPPTTQGASVAENNSTTSNNNNGGASSQEAGHYGNEHTAVGELANMSSKERDDLNNFIRQVLEQPPMDLANLLSEEPRGRSAENDENVGVLLTARTSGKIIVYCQEDGSTSTKVVHATPNMKYSEFASIIERKFGRPMALSFYEGDDVIELDDDDGLAMFLEMCTQAGNNKKVRLICSDPATRRHVVEDLVTAERPTLLPQQQQQQQMQMFVPQQQSQQQQQTPSSVRVMPYSNGELKVQLLRTYTGHTLAVYSCSFSPRGDFFVTASRDRSVRLWNTKTGSCSVMKGGHNGFVLSCHFSPKGNRVVSSSDDRTIKIWNTTTCNKVCTLKGHEDKVYSVQYNSTGEYIVSGSCDHTVRVWNAESFSKMVTLKGHTLAVFSCGFSNSDRGRYVVSGSDDRLIKIWDWGSAREVRSLVGHIGTVWSVCFSHSDRYIVSASMDHELKLWEANTGVCVRTMNGHATPIHHAIFSDNDMYIFSCARDWSTMVWRTDNGERVEVITGHQSTVYHMDIQGNRLLTSSLDDTLCLWSVTPAGQDLAATAPPGTTVPQIIMQQQQQQ